jgi:hypothetical protein
MITAGLVGALEDDLQRHCEYASNLEGDLKDGEYLRT